MCIIFLFLWWWRVRVPSQEHPKSKDHGKMVESFPREGKKEPWSQHPHLPLPPRLDRKRLRDALQNKEQRGCSSWLSPLHSFCPLHILKCLMVSGINQTLSWNKSFNPCAAEAAGGRFTPWLLGSSSQQITSRPLSQQKGWIYIQRNWGKGREEVEEGGSHLRLKLYIDKLVTMNWII